MSSTQQIQTAKIARTLATSLLLLVALYSLIRRIFQLKLVFDGAASATFVNNNIDSKLTYLIGQLLPLTPTS
jgi:hypothetical protein